MSWWFCSHSLVEFPTTLGNMIHSPLAGAHIDPAGLSLLYTHMYIHQYIQVNVNDYFFKHFSEIAWLLWSSWSNRKKFEPPKWAASAGDEEILGSRRWFRILVMLVVILMTTMTVLWVRLSDCWQVLSKRVSEVWGRNWSLFRESDLNGARQTWEDELQLPKKFICNLNMSSGKMSWRVSFSCGSPDGISFPNKACPVCCLKCWGNPHIHSCKWMRYPYQCCVWVPLLKASKTYHKYIVSYI